MSLRISTDLIGRRCLAIPSSSVRLGHYIPVSSVWRTKAIGCCRTYQHHRFPARGLHTVPAMSRVEVTRERGRISDGFP
jgi:hypothetical protein